jgi:predicted branched-subunit amino acid permease
MIEENIRAEVVRGVKDAFPVLFAVAPYAMVLGAQASQVRLSVGEVTTMTGLNFAGGSEFAAIQLWSAPIPI